MGSPSERGSLAGGRLTKRSPAKKCLAQATAAQQLFDRPAHEMGRPRRAEPLEHGRHEVGGVVGPGARSRPDPGSPGDEPAVGRVVARAAGGQLPAPGPADLAEPVGDHAGGRPRRPRGVPQHDEIGKKAAARRGGGISSSTLIVPRITGLPVAMSRKLRSAASTSAITRSASPGSTQPCFSRPLRLRRT